MFGSLVGIVCIESAFGVCSKLDNLGMCPSMSPTYGGCLHDCQTFWTYSAQMTYLDNPFVAGPCQNPRETSFSSPYSWWTASHPGQCSTGGDCGYVETAASVNCTTTTCDGWGC